jgi:3-hydroxyacyl-CoA dehydrogenase/enoyl-CoA hydratase/3-hydroxybutyryl-CoA epimerase/enoyl-CoA isomerase
MGLADGSCLFTDRMPLKPEYSVAKLYGAQRFGQKNGKGFYVYSIDAKGKPKKEVSPEIYPLLGLDSAKLNTADANTITDAEIVDRLMLPFILESSRCLAEKIVDEAYELDLAMLNGLGFPPFRGGPMRYAQSIGANTIIEKGNTYAKKYGSLYEVTAGAQEVLKNV